MAELGNLFGGSTAAANDFKVEVEMLDYSYVNECTDWKQLNMIVDVLKSGKEGYYPDVSIFLYTLVFLIPFMTSLSFIVTQLIRVAEEKLVALLPAKEKRRYESLSHKTTPSEIAEAESELSSWSRSVASKDEQLLHAQQQSVRASADKALPPVRGSGAPSSSKPAVAATSDAVVESSSTQSANADILALLNASQGKKFLRQSAELGAAGLSEVKRAHRAGAHSPYICFIEQPLYVCATFTLWRCPQSWRRLRAMRASAWRTTQTPWPATAAAWPTTRAAQWSGPTAPWRTFARSCSTWRRRTARWRCCWTPPT